MYENLHNNNNLQRQKLYAQQEHGNFLRNSFNQQIQHSSEYGSADPSPTNPYSKGNQSFDSSDSEAEDTIAMYYKNVRVMLNLIRYNSVVREKTKKNGSEI
jgi:hypothetical protein